MRAYERLIAGRDAAGASASCMGGVIALGLAARHPSLVRGLVLQEPALWVKQDTGWDVLSAIIPIMMLSKLGMKARAAERFSRWTYGSGGTGYDQFPEAWRESVRKNVASTCQEIDQGAGENFLTPEDIRGIERPVVGLLGECSLPYYRRCMERLRGLLAVPGND